MQGFEMYASALVVLGVAILLVLAGIGKNQLVWKQRKPLPARIRRRP